MCRVCCHVSTVIEKVTCLDELDDKSAIFSSGDINGRLPLAF